MTTVLVVFSSILLVFGIYGRILRKFYKRKRNYETIREESQRELFTEEHPIQFSATTVFIIPITFEPPLSMFQSDVSLQKIKYVPDNGGQCTEISERPKRIRKISTISRGFSFHVSYIKSSNYVLIILLTFCIFHAPLFFYHTLQLGK